MSHNDADRARPRRRVQSKVVAAALLGSALEWYDYFLFGTVAALAFNSVFFPNQSTTVSLLLVFATFGVGFVVRPVGAVVFSHIGDKHGRKPALVGTLTLMGFATAAMGLIPSYSSIGVWAPILLVALRLLQGMGSGAEYAGAAVFAVEYAPDRRRGLFGSFASSGVYLGLVLSSAFVLPILAVTEDAEFAAWGWRIPFLASVVLVALGLWIRLRLEETPAYERDKEENQKARFPLVTFLRTQWRTALLVMGVVAAPIAFAYIYQAYALSHLDKLGLSDSVGTAGLIIAGIVTMATIPIAGAASDRFGRRPVLMSGAVFAAAYAFPFFWLVGTEIAVVVWLAMALAQGLSVGIMFGVQGVVLSELFATHTRYSGAAVSREVASVVFGGLTPLIATGLAASAGGAYWPVALYIVGLSAITFAAAVAIPETYRARIAPANEDTERPSTVRQHSTVHSVQ